MPHEGAAALPRAQAAVSPPLELDDIGAAVALDRCSVFGAERLGDGRPDVVAVVADKQPADPFEALDQVSWERVKHGDRVGHWSRAPAPRRR